MSQFNKIALVFVLLSMGGCSGTTFVYNRLGFLISWYVDDYVNLSWEQRSELRVLLRPFLQWHRGQELPLYLDILENIEALLEQKISGEDVAAIASQFEQAWYRTEWKSLEWMLGLGEQLSDAQMAEFLQSLQDKQLEYEEEYLTRSDEVFRKETYENLRDPVQDYLGRLDWGQREVLRQVSADLRRSDSIWLEERVAWLGRLEDLLQREPGWQQAVRDAIAQRQQTVSEGYLEVYEYNARVIHNGLARLLNTRTDKQDWRLRKKIGELHEDIQTLVDQGP